LSRRYYDLPTLTSLSTFESCARNGSFKAAADELNVTPGAVSRQIKSLEEDLNLQVFERNPNGVTLTAEAEDLFRVATQSFTRMSEAVQRTKNGGNKQQRVTLACTNAIAALWLMPRMGEFWSTYPDIFVDHLISDNTRDYRRPGIDLKIRYGNGKWHNEKSQLLLNEEIYPVCSRKYAEMHTGAEAKDLPDLSLLHVDWLDPAWTGWDELLNWAGISAASLSGRRFSSFEITLRAAEENQGVAVGWNRLVKDRIDSGRLVKFPDLSMPAPGAYNLSASETAELSPAAQILQKWLMKVARE